MTDPTQASSAAQGRYIDAGDRVVVTEGVNENAHARPANPDVAGQHGIVESNDGWGRCCVLLDSGQRVTLWNGIDLDWEAVEVSDARA